MRCFFSRPEDGGAGLWEAGGPHSPRPRLRVGSQGGMPTRSPPEAGLAGDEFPKYLPIPSLRTFWRIGEGKVNSEGQKPGRGPWPLSGARGVAVAALDHLDRDHAAEGTHRREGRGQQGVRRFVT